MDADWFAGRLRELREQAGLTQAGLADRAGLSASGVQDLEQGRRHPAWKTVIALCAALDVSPEAFVQPPGQLAEPKRGRPRKPAPEAPEAPAPPPGKRRTRKK